MTGLTEALRVLPRSFAMLRRLTAAAREQRPDVFVRHRFSRLQLPPDGGAASARHSGRLLHQPAALGVAAGPHGDDEAVRRSRAGHLSVRGGALPARRVPVEFVGHPLVDLVRVQQPRAALLREHGLDPEAPTVALLPGSRPNELTRIVPAMAASLPLIRARVPGRAVPGRGRAESAGCAVRAAPDWTRWPRRGRSAGCVRDAPTTCWRRRDVVDHRVGHRDRAGGAARAADGRGLPAVAADVRLGKPFVRVDTYAMANLVAGKRVVPELIQEDFTPERVADETVRFLTDRELSRGPGMN